MRNKLGSITINGLSQIFGCHPIFEKKSDKVKPCDKCKEILVKKNQRYCKYCSKEMRVIKPKRLVKLSYKGFNQYVKQCKLSEERNK